MAINDDDKNANPFAKFVTAPTPAPAAVQATDGAGTNPFAQFVDPSYRAPPRNSFGGTIRDLALDAVGGGLDIGKQAYGLANLAVGGLLDPASRSVTGPVARAATQAGNLLTGQDLPAPTNEQADSIAQGFQQADQGLAGLQTPFRQQAEAQRAQAMQEASGPLDETRAALSESLGTPTMLLGDIVRSGASMFAPAVGAEAITERFGAQVFDKAAKRALAAGATHEAAQAAGEAAVGKLGEHAVIGVTGVGQVAGGDDVDTINNVIDTSPQAMAANPQYQQLIASGMSDVAARDELARKAGLVNALVAAPISMAASKLTGAGRQLAEVATGNYAGKGIVDLLHAAGKEATQEVLESGGERLGQNLGQQAYGDQSTPTWKGVAAEATLGGLAGVFMGAGEHLLGGHNHAGEHRVEDTAGQPANAGAAAPTPAAPAGPITRAAAIASVAGASLFPFSDAAMAQKQADARTNTTGVPHEVVDHPTVAGRFAAAPVAQQEQAAPPAPAAAAPAAVADDDLADLFGSPQAPAAPQPAAFKPGDQVQVTLNGVDQFKDGTRVVSMSPDGSYAMVEGSNSGVPVSSLTRLATDAAPATPVDQAAHAAASSPQNDLAPPTKAQIAANNGTLGHEKVGGLAISFENPAGSVRQDKENDPPEWESTLQDHYGYIKGVPARSPDKEHVDVFVKPGTPKDYSGPAFVVDQNNQDGDFDEAKVVLGAHSLDDARATYLRNYPAGSESQIRGITQLSLPELKARLQDPAGFMQPQQPGADAQPQAAASAAPAGTPAPAAQQQPAPAGQAPTFTTTDGTGYTVEPSGRTTSGQATGKKGKVAPVTSQVPTVYLAPDAMKQINDALQNAPRGVRRGVDSNNGQTWVYNASGAQAGARVVQVPHSATPAVGLHPLELVGGERAPRFGGAITQLGGATPATQQGSPAAAPAKPVSTQPAAPHFDDAMQDLFGQTATEVHAEQHGAVTTAGTTTPAESAPAAPNGAPARPDVDSLTDHQVHDLHEAMGLYLSGATIPKMRKRIKAAGPERIEQGFRQLDVERAWHDQIAKAGEPHGLVPVEHRGIMGVNLALREDAEAPFVQINQLGDDRYSVRYRGDRSRHWDAHFDDLDSALKESAAVLRESDDDTLSDEQRQANVQRRRAEAVARDAANRAVRDKADEVMAALEEYGRQHQTGVQLTRDKVIELIREKGIKTADDTIKQLKQSIAESKARDAQETRKRLAAIAQRLGLTVVEVKGGFRAAAGQIEIPAEDAEVDGALTPAHVFAHELGHAVVSKRGLSFKGFPTKEMTRWVANWDELVAASKRFRPSAWAHQDERIRRYVRKPNEVLADAIGSVLLGEEPLSLLKPFMEKTGTTVHDLGLDQQHPEGKGVVEAGGPVTEPPKAKKLTPKQQAAEEERKRNEAYWEKARADARARWKVGMVTSLPGFADVEGSDQKYTMGLPGVIEAIDGDHADVRIYAAPEYGYTLEDYPLHGKLAVNVPLTELGNKSGRGMEELTRIAEEGKLATGDADVAASVRARMAKVKYPNRNFGEFAQTRPTALENASNPKWWAEVALMNMRRGDTFAAGGQTYTVEAVKKIKDGDQTRSGMTLRDGAGAEHTFWPQAPEWHKLLPQLAEQLKAEDEMAATEKRPLLDILKRDPAAHIDEKGGLYLADQPHAAKPMDNAALPANARVERFGADETPPEFGADANQDAIANPEKYAFNGRFRKSLNIKRAIEHVGGETVFRTAVEQEFLDQARDGYPVLADEQQNFIENLAGSMLEFDAGNDKPAYAWRRPEFTEQPDLIDKEFPRNLHPFPEPGKTVWISQQMNGKPVPEWADKPVLPQERAAAIVEGWKAEAKRIGREQSNSHKVVISLYDRSGIMSQPWEDAGYTVFRYDLARGDNLIERFPIVDIVNLQESGHEIVGVIAQPPCTSFASSGARFWAAQHDIGGDAGRAWVAKKYGQWAAKYFDKPVEVGEFLAMAAREVVSLANPSAFHILENPRGRIAKVLGLPKATMVVNPNMFGDPYTKETFLYGDFNTDLPTAIVSAAEEDGGQGSKIHKLRGTSEEDKEERSTTPEGMAYALFMANQPRVAALDKQPAVDPDPELVEQAKQWGYKADAVPKNGVIQGHKTALFYDNGVPPGAKAHLSFRIEVAQGPNGKWAMAPSYLVGDKGAAAVPSVDTPMHDSRAAALEAGVEVLRAALPKSAIAKLDKAYAETKPGLQQMQGAKAARAAQGETEPPPASKAPMQPGLAKMQQAKAAREQEASKTEPTDDELFDAEWQDAVSHLGDVLGDVFGSKLNITGPQHTAGDLLPALSKVIELLVRKGLRSFKKAVSTAARGMRQNDKTAQHVDRISARQWKAAYNAIAELHEGTDSEETVNAIPADEVLGLVAPEQAAARVDQIGDQHKAQRAAVEPAPAAASDEDYHGFGAALPPMQRARLKQALSRQMRFNGEFRTRKAEIERRVANGGRIEEHAKDGRRLFSPSGSYLTEADITKTAMDYAAHLIAQHGAEQHPPARYTGPADVSSVAGQKELASRAGTIATLKMMNEQLRKIAPDEAWADENIEHEPDLDSLRTRISNALYAAQHPGKASVNGELRAQLEELSGKELRAAVEHLNLLPQDRVLTHSQRVDMVLGDRDPDAIRAALASVTDGQPDSTTGAQHVEGDASEPVTPAVVTQSLMKEAARTKIDYATAKANLLAAIDAAIAEREAKPKTLPKKITFDVPGDGKFTVLNTVEKLQDFKKRAIESKGFEPLPKKRTAAPRRDKNMGVSDNPTAAIGHMLQDGEKVAAYELAKAIGKPFRFVAHHADGSPLLIRDARDAELPFGIKGFVGKTEKAKGYAFTELGSGYTVGGNSFKTVEAAIRGAREAVEKAGEEKVRATIASAPQIDQAKLEAEWLAAAEKSDNEMAEQLDAAGKRAARQQAQYAADQALWEELGGEDRVPSSTQPPEMRAVEQLLEKANKLGKLPEAEELIERRFTPAHSPLLYQSAIQKAKVRAELNERDIPADPASYREFIRKATGGTTLDNLVIGDVERLLRQAPAEAVDGLATFIKGQRPRLTLAVNRALAEIGKAMPEPATPAATQAEAIPEGFKPVGEPYYKGGVLTQGYAPYAPGDRVIDTETRHQGVVEAPFGAGPFFSQLMVKYDNGSTATVPVSRLEAEPDLNGFTRTDTGGGDFTLRDDDNNLLVKVASLGNGKYQASLGSARSSPHLTEQGAVDWATAYLIEKDRTAALAAALVERANGKPYALSPAQQAALDRFTKASETGKIAKIERLFLYEGELHMSAKYNANGDVRVAKIDRDGKVSVAPNGILGFGFAERRHDLIPKAEYDRMEEAEAERKARGAEVAAESAKPRWYTYAGANSLMPRRIVVADGVPQQLVGGKLQKRGRGRFNQMVIDNFESAPNDWKAGEAYDKGTVKEPWEMTLGEYTTARLEENEYRDLLAEDADARASFDEYAERDWIKALSDRAKSGRIPDAVLDDLVARNGINYVLSVFRGVNEKGIEGYLAPEVRNGPALASPAAESEAAPDLDGATYLARHQKLIEAARNGQVTAQQFKDAYQYLVDSAQEIKAELAKSTKDTLLRAGGQQFSYRYKNDNKPDVVKALYHDMLTDFVISGGGISYSPLGGVNGYERGLQQAVTKRVQALTDADMQAFAERVASAHREREQAHAAREAGMANPQTLDDFKALLSSRMRQQDLTMTQARLSLTPEQRVRVDELAAEKSRGERAQRKEEQSTSIAVAGQLVDGKIIETKHTKKGHDLFVVQLSERVATEDYKKLEDGAKRIGGYYSPYRGRGAVPGFTFTTRAQAEAFVQLAQGDNAAAIEAAKERRDAFADDRSQTAVERLNEMADLLAQRADEVQNAERKVNTARRAAHAAAAESSARRQQAMADTMRRIAQAIADGKAKFLDRVRQKVQVELLNTLAERAHLAAAEYEFPMTKDDGRWRGRAVGFEKRLQQPVTVADMDHAEWPTYTAYRSDLAKLGRQLSEVDGTKLLGQKILGVADDVSDAYLKFAKEHLTEVATFSTKDGKRAAFASKALAEEAIARSGYHGKAIVLAVKRGENLIILSPAEAMARGVWQGDDDRRITLNPEIGAEIVKKLGRINRYRNRVDVPWQFETAHYRRAVLERMGIENAPELRAALREYMALKVAPKEADKVKELERAMVGRRDDGLDFFPTPADQADDMIAAADLKPGMRVLEPSAGMGHIADRIREAGFVPDVVEMAHDRRQLLEAKGYEVVAHDFMDLKANDAPAVPRSELEALEENGAVRADVLSSVRSALNWYDQGDYRGAALMLNRAARQGEFNPPALAAMDGLEARLTAAAGGKYDRIIMNPPFSDRRDVAHVMHAYDLLKPGGRLVAIMGEGTFYGKDKRAQAFRDWIEEHGGTSEKLAEGTFMDPSLPVNTGANARMIVVDKPAAEVAPAVQQPAQTAPPEVEPQENLLPEASAATDSEGVSPEIVEDLRAELKRLAETDDFDAFRYEMFAKRLNAAEAGRPDAVAWAMEWHANLVQEREAARQQEQEAIDQRAAEDEALRAELAQGRSTNPRYQAYLDTVENPDESKNWQYMAWNSQRVAEFKKERGEEGGDRTQSQQWQDALTAYMRAWADKHLSERVKAQRATAQGEVDVPAPQQETEVQPAPAAGLAAHRNVDVGEQLYANRRNFTGRGLTWNDVQGLNETLRVKEVTKAKVWPRPNYEQLVAEGMPTVLARMIKQVYDGIAAGPTAATMTDDVLQRYIETLTKVREGLFNFVQDREAVSNFAKSVVEAIKPSAARGPISLLDMAREGKNDIGKMLVRRIWPEEFNGSSSGLRSFARGTRANSELAVIGGNKALNALQFGSTDFRKWADDLSKGWPAKREAWQVQGYEVLEPGQYTVDGPHQAKRWDKEAGEMVPTGEVYYTLARKVGRGSWMSKTPLATDKPTLVLDSGSYNRQFDTREAAIEAAREQVKRDAKSGPDLGGINIADAERSGPARRAEGQDITSQQLMETFGFRGVNFGREGWINQAQRQEYLNQAYDGLHDLADILGVPTKALSLNGEMGIAFGAQGKGKFAAHFVPGVNEINLTKTKGAGTLAHEWGHALDHWFAKQAGLAKEEEPFLSEHATLPAERQRTKMVDGKWQTSLEKTFSGPIRDAILDAYRSLREAMDKRSETDDEAKARFEHNLAGGKRKLDATLSAIRGQIEQSKAGNKDKLLASFDTHADRMRAGDAGDGSLKSGNKSYLARVAKVRELVKDATGRLLSGSDTDQLEAVASWVSHLLGKQFAGESHEPQRLTSTFRSESMKIDRDKGGKAYWSTPTEMFARAFELYVADKLAERSQQNTFLTDAAERAAATKEVEDNSSAFARGAGSTKTVHTFPYPRGSEREATAKAFQTLVDAMQTRETDKGVELFSRGGLGLGMQRAAVQQVLAPVLRSWKNAPPVTVVQRVAELPFAAKGDTRGAYGRGRVWLVADNLHSASEVQFALAHEALGHAGLAAILDEKALKQELNRLRLINPALAKAARAQATKYGYDLTLATEEALADMAGDGQIIKGWQKFVNLVQRALRFVGFDSVADWIEGKTAAETMTLLRRASEAITESEQARQEQMDADAEAVLFARTEDGWGRSVRDPNFRQVVKRTPELQAAAQLLKDGKLTKEQYARLVEKYKPVSEYQFVPPPANDADMREALSSDKVPRIGAPLATLQAGHPVGVRLDIPAYANHGVWVVAVHEQLPSFAAGKSIGYDSMAAVTNATFGVVQRAALDIAAGKAKSTIAVIKGSWRPISREKAVEAAQRALASPEWRQIGMHPERHAYFFDRGNMRPVVAADAVIQVGPLVLARNVKYGSMDDVLFSRGDSIAVDGVQRPTTNSDGVPIAASDKQLRAFWRWFGNSKAVDANGRPLIVYHGTKGDFAVFDGTMIGEGGDKYRNLGDYGDGFYFTRDREYAEGVANGIEGAGKPKVMAVYLRMQNPIEESELLKVEGVDGILSDPYPGETISGLLQERGFDGITVKDGDELVVFDPAQIKSVDNVGTFDPNNSDIRFSRGEIGEQRFGRATVDVDGVARPAFDSNGRELAGAPVTVRAFWRWFGNSQVTDEQGRPLPVYLGTEGDFVFRGPTSFVDNPEAAAADGSKLVRAYLKIVRPYHWTAGSDKLTPRKINELRQDGYDGIIAEDSGSGEKRYIVFDPAQFVRFGAGRRWGAAPARTEAEQRAADTREYYVGQIVRLLKENRSVTADAIADQFGLDRQMATAYLSAAQRVTRQADDEAYRNERKRYVRQVVSLLEQDHTLSADDIAGQFGLYRRTAADYLRAARQVLRDRGIPGAVQIERAKRDLHVAAIVGLLEKQGAATTDAIAEQLRLDRSQAAGYLFYMHRNLLLVRHPTSGSKLSARFKWELGADPRMSSSFSHKRGIGERTFPVELSLPAIPYSALDELDNQPVQQRSVLAQQVGIERDPMVAALFGETSTVDQNGLEEIEQGQQAVTDTPAFRRWFGDSEVVDADGKPRVVYHGTGMDIEQFEGFQMAGWFSESPTLAALYTNRDVQDSETGETISAPNIVPAYLSIQNPLVLDVDMNDRTVRGREIYDNAGLSRKGVDRYDLYHNDTAWQVINSSQFADAAKEAGYDGIRVNEGGTPTWAIFQPEQAKSAIGNSGEFDPNNSDIRFSRAGDTIQAVADSLRSGTTLRAIAGNVDAAMAQHKAFNNFGLYERTFSTQYNKARKDKDFRAVFEPVLQQVDDTAHYAIEAEQMAPGVLMRLKGIKDIMGALFSAKRSKQHAADMKAIAGPLFANIEGKRGVRQYLFTDEELARDFGLTPNQIGLYRQTRAAIDTSIERLAQTAVMTVGQAQGVPVAHMRDMSLADTAALVKEALWEQQRDRHFAEVVQAENEGLEKPLFEPDMTILDNIDGIVEESKFLQGVGYMPALRFGTYAVTVRDPNAEPGSDPLDFQTFENQIAAHAGAARLAKQYPGMTVTRSTMNDERYKMFKGVSPESVELFARFTGADQEQAYKDYIALSRSARSSKMRELERHGIAGFSEDVSRVVAAFLLSNARQAALNVNSQNIADALAAPALAKKGDVQKEAQRLVEYVSNPAEEAHTLRGALFTYFIGGSVASAFVNLTQPLLQTLPWLTEFVGARAPALLMAAGRMAATGKVAPHLETAFRRAANEGLTEPMEMHTLMGDASGSMMGSSLRARAMMQAWGGFFGQAESFNRRITFLAAYQAALDMGKAKLREKGFADAYDFAKRALAETQGLYSKANRPDWGRGPVGAVLLTFKQFSIVYLEMLMRMPWQQRAIALALLTLGAGVEGWPFAENVEDLIDTLGQSLGYATNSKKWLRHVAGDVLGETFGPMLLHGVQLIPGGDLGGRISLGRMIPGTQMLKLSDSKRDTNDTGGAFGSLMQAAHDAAMAAQVGNWGQAAINLAPTSVKNMIAGVRMAESGHYRDTQGRPTIATTPYEAALKFFGVQPASVARESEIVGDINQDRSLMGVVQGAIVQQWARAIVEHDPEQVAAVVAKWQTWNRDNPGARLIITPAQLRAKVMELSLDRRIRTIKGAPPALRAEAVADLNQQ